MYWVVLLFWLGTLFMFLAQTSPLLFLEKVFNRIWIGWPGIHILVYLGSCLKKAVQWQRGYRSFVCHCCLCYCHWVSSWFSGFLLPPYLPVAGLLCPCCPVMDCYPILMFLIQGSLNNLDTSHSEHSSPRVRTHTWVLIYWCVCPFVWSVGRNTAYPVLIQLCLAHGHTHTHAQLTAQRKREIYIY